MLNDEQIALADYFEQFYLINSSLPSRDFLVSTIGIVESLYDRCLSSKEWLDHVEGREVNIREYLPVTGTASNIKKLRSAGKGLSGKQLAVCNLMLDFSDNRSDLKKLREIGVTTAQWEAWKRDPAVQSYLRARAENLLGDNQHLMQKAHLERIAQGDMGAIKLAYEMTGIFIPERGTKANESAADTKMIIMRILEVLQRRITDPELLVAVGEDIMAIAQQYQIASAMGNAAPEPMPKVLYAGTRDNVPELSGL